MRLVKRLRGLFGAHASKVTVRPQVSWWFRAFVLIFVAAFFFTVLWWTLRAYQRFVGLDETAFKEKLSKAINTIEQLRNEGMQLKSRLAMLQQQAEIDHIAQTELSKSVGQLQEENAHLKEEVAFFRKIMPSSGTSDLLSVQNFRVEPNGLPNEYRFHALLVQGGQRDKDFIGRVQLLITLQQEPASNPANVSDDDKLVPPMEVNFKYYQRLDGHFKIKPGVAVKFVNLRVTEKSTGRVRLTRSLRIS